MVDTAGRVLELGDFRFLSLANPKHAPYGRAAQEVLEARGLWQNLQSRIVRGENIGQAFQYVISGNAELGFVARSQVERPGEVIPGSWWEIPVDLYSPIAQQAVLLSESAAASELLDFVRGQESLDILRSYGYRIP
jgi:molybdate transport system substrate-binding protein